MSAAVSLYGLISPDLKCLKFLRWVSYVTKILLLRKLDLSACVISSVPVAVTPCAFADACCDVCFQTRGEWWQQLGAEASHSKHILPFPVSPRLYIIPHRLYVFLLSCECSKNIKSKCAQFDGANKSSKHGHYHGNDDVSGADYMEEFQPGVPVYLDPRSISSSRFATFWGERIKKRNFHECL